MKTGNPIVFVVDNDSSMREALTDLINSIGLLVEALKSAREFLEHRKRDAPACLVLDVRLPDLSGLDLQRELVRTEAPIPIIFITGNGDIPMAVRAIKEGAVDFLAKPFRDQDLLDAIQHALEIDRAARQERAVVAEVRRRYESLTKREREVMRLVVSGLLNKQIAGELGSSEVTVKMHRGQVMRKMKAQTLVQLVRMADKIGITSEAELPTNEKLIPKSSFGKSNCWVPRPRAVTCEQRSFPKAFAF
jgi:FixJ family two-component response regulator